MTTSAVDSLFSRPTAGQDMVILVVGATGTGKSSLINIAVGRETCRVGHSLEACTTSVQSVRCRYRNKKTGAQITMVDTPALPEDDSNGELDSIETQLKKCLKKTGVRHATGILYLHKISSNRLTAPSARIMRAFGRICGKEVSSKIVLMTTMWDMVNRGVGESREGELKTKYWNGMLNKGSHIVQSDGTSTSVWAAVDLIAGDVE